MSSLYKTPRAGIAAAIKGLLAAENVAADEPAVAAGLAALEAGGDFADGVIAYQGRALGGEMFVSFDRKAVDILATQSISARLLA